MAWEERKRLQLTFGHGRGGIELIDRSMSNVICICLISQTLVRRIRYNNRWLVLITITGQFLFQIAIFCEKKEQANQITAQIAISLFFFSSLALKSNSRRGWNPKKIYSFPGCPMGMCTTCSVHHLKVQVAFWFTSQIRLPPSYWHRLEIISSLVVNRSIADWLFNSINRFISRSFARYLLVSVSFLDG